MTGVDPRRPELLGRLLPRVVTPGATAAADVVRVWAGVVGEDVARNARPLSLRRGKLVVATSSAAWAQTLQTLSGGMAARLNSELGEGVVDTLVFRHAGWVPGPEPAEAAAQPGGRRTLSAEEETAIAEVVALAGNEELGRRVAAAMRADLEGRPAGGPDSCGLGEHIGG